MIGVVLSKRDYREKDQIVSIFTKSYGKLELLSKGSKKITSKNFYFLEPFTLLEFNVVKTKSWNRITKLHGLDSFVDIKKDLKKNLLAGYCVKLLDNILEVADPNENIFRLLLRWLLFLDKIETPTSFEVDAFLVQFISQIGFQPDIELLPPENSIKGFYIPEARPVKKTEFSEIEEKQHVVDCEKRDLEILASALDFDFKKKFKTKKSSKFHNIVISLIRYHAQESTKDWKHTVATN